MLGETITAAAGDFDTQLTVGRQQWDDGLMASMSMIYQHVLIYTTIITQVLIKKRVLLLNGRSFSGNT